MVGITSSLFGPSRRALHRLSKTYSLSRDDARRQAVFRLAERHLFGRDDEPRDGAKAISYLKEALLRGCLLAQSVIGFIYEFGLGGVDVDLAEAERLYIDAANKGEGLSQARLAFLRKYGRPGVKIDRVEAKEWQERVNEQGEGAIQWLMDAAEEENEPSAQYSLGVCYHDGVGVQKDASIAVFCMLKIIKFLQ